MVKFAKLLIKSIPILNQKAATENRAALRISFADSCSAQGGPFLFNKKEACLADLYRRVHSFLLIQCY